MKKLCQQHKKAAAIALVVFGVIVVPFLIHVLFKLEPKQEFWIAEWTAGDFLGFYGVLLGSAATVAGVFLTIRYTQSQYKQDLIDRSLPFITITKVIKEDKQPVDRYYYIMEKRDVSVMASLTAKQERLKSSGGFYEQELHKGVVATHNANLLCTLLSVENVGNGAATSFSIGLYIPPYNREANPHCFSISRSLRAGEKIQVFLYSTNENHENTGDYELCVSYYDIFGNQYEQKFDYSIYEENGSAAAKLSLKGTQKRIQSNERKI